MPTAPASLRITGHVQTPSSFGPEDLARLPVQVPDVSALVPGRQGAAVRLGALIDAARPKSGATHVTLTAEGGRFSASVPLDFVREALVIYRLGDEALPGSMGGPFRFLIPDAKSCRDTSLPVDRCANVKFLEHIELTAGPGRDTRPTEEERERRHARER